MLLSLASCELKSVSRRHTAASILCAIWLSSVDVSFVVTSEVNVDIELGVVLGVDLDLGVLLGVDLDLGVLLGVDLDLGVLLGVDLDLGVDFGVDLDLVLGIGPSDFLGVEVACTLSRSDICVAYLLIDRISAVEVWLECALCLGVDRGSGVDPISSAGVQPTGFDFRLHLGELPPGVDLGLADA